MSADRAYFDWNASAPLRPEAREATAGAMDVIGNPSSIHAEGRRARDLVETAREQVAALVGASPVEVVFTSGATEANAWALGGWDTIFLSGIEHDSVRAPAKLSGARLIDIPTGPDGQARIGVIARRIPERDALGCALVTLQMANNETGVIQPVVDAVSLAREHGLSVHTDATQAAGRAPIDFAGLGVDLLSLSSHKLGGPKGIGALVVRDGVTIAPLIAGGGQERRRRAGTENVAAIAGFGAAAAAALRDLEHITDLAARRDVVERGLIDVAPECFVIGQSSPRLANTMCIAWPGKSAETLVIKLDLAGVAVSAGAACSSGKVGSSHVLEAMGLADDVAKCAIRVSLGLTTSDRDIQRLLAAWLAVRGPRPVDADRGNTGRADTIRPRFERIPEGV
ncbi:MAG: cysteine desulfurase family protein [Hyphomicrobiaceae bacterium]